MRPPVTKLRRVDNDETAAQSDKSDSKAEALAEKAKLARHLHDQAVNPVNWTAAHPAPHTEQKTFQETGRKTRDNQFEVDGRLYNWSPAVAATSEQAKAIAGAYTAEANLAPIETLVDIEKVPLKHSFGEPHAARGDMSPAEEKIALYRHYARSGIDPDKAHLGDPLPMPAQEKLKAEMAKIPIDMKLDVPGQATHYQGFDDGWIYAANDATKESEEVQRIRRDHVAQLSGSDPASANDNDPEMEAAIVKYYNDRESATKTEPDRLDAQSNAPSDASPPVQLTEAERNELAKKQIRDMAEWMPALVKLIEKEKSDEPLTPDEQAFSEEVRKRFAAVNVVFDPEKTNLEYLQEITKAAEHAATSTKSRVPLFLTAASLNAGVAEALVNGTMSWAKLGQIGWPEGLRRSIKLLKDDRIKGVVGSLAAGTNVAEIIANKDVEMPDLLSMPAKWGRTIVEEASSLLGNENTASQSSADSSVERDRRQRTLTPATPQTLKSLSSGLADASAVQLWIGGKPLYKQGEHKTLMDNIFREEFIKVAQEKGCLPDPNDPKDKRQFKEYGGDKSQKRITDTEQRGHLGSRQTDGAIEWQDANGNVTETHWNSTTSKADGFTESTREWNALIDIVVKIDKHLAMGGDMRDLYELTRNPVRGKGPVYHMTEKRDWTEDDLREFIRKKLRDRFDKDFKDCKFIGESRLVKLDDPNDPDLPQKP